jgi:septal ring factor EnvC (AmiA/AmiB activator)
MMGASTRQLTSVPLVLVSDRRARMLMSAALVAALVALAAAAALRLYAGGAGVLAGRDRLRQDNSALQAEVARLEAEIELERATRSALDTQVAELNRRIEDLERELAFVHAQNGRPRRTKSPN